MTSGAIFNGAVALCNTGVSLLQSNCHEEARYVFQVALKVITSEMNNKHGHDVSSLCTNAHVKRDNPSSTLVWNLVRKGQQQLLLDSAVEKQSPFVEICVLSDRFDPTVVDRYLTERSNKAVIFIIKIESASVVPSSHLHSRQECEILSATLVQNIASTFLYQAMNLDCSDAAVEVVLDSAYNLYNTSQKIFGAVLKTHNSYVVPEVAAILSSVLRNMKQTAHHLGDAVACQTLNQKLQCILCIIAKLSLFGIYNSHLAHASVA
jgi:hypothetical protein